MISGARYQRVATYSVRNPVWSWSGSATRAKPKSQICGGCERDGRRSMVGVRMMSLMLMMFSCLKRMRILISLRVRWQYVWCSKGLIFLMATRVLLSRSCAALITK
ncbi:hypothetical protein EYF80_031608 [Liparis tanakae]|uniref:Uncharacterized protein n=1 Tax=Liparis tanakae TaxID=230148 RepID=A0A4Z2GYJ6_9TELE|nr:hypothetical protein EYF80_031608 [Liparis tanakae]